MNNSQDLSEDLLEPSFFSKQFNELDNINIGHNIKKNYVNIDSSKRIKIDKVFSKKIDTIDKFMKVFNNKIFLIIVNPLQFNKNNNEKILENIKILFKWVNISKFNYNPKTILDINSENILFYENKGYPIFDATLTKYDEDSDRGYYLINDLFSQENGFFSSKNKYGYLEIRFIENIIKGYPNPNKYRINLQKSYKNVVSVKMISSNFPIPHYDNNNISNINDVIYLEIPKLIYKQNIVLELNKNSSLKNHLLELVNKLYFYTEKYNIFPLLFYKNYFRLYLLKFLIKKDDYNINYYSKNIITLFIKTEKNIPTNNLCLILDQQYKGFYRVNVAYEYIIYLDEVIPDDIDIGDKIIFNKTLYGCITQIKDGNKIQVSTLHKNKIKQSDIILIQNKVTVIVEQIHLLGESIPLFCKKICNLNDYIYLPEKYGIYTLNLFKISYLTNCLLSNIKLNNIDILTYSINNYNKIYTIEADVEKMSNNYINIQFNGKTIPKKSLYKIINIHGNNINKKDAFPSTRNILIASSNINDNNQSQLFFNKLKDVQDLNENQNIKVLYENKTSQYCKIITKNIENMSIIVDTKLDLKYPIIGIRNNITDAGIIKKKQLDLYESEIVEDVLRNENILIIKKNKHLFKKEYIIQIGLQFDDPSYTNSELNIINNIENIDDEYIKIYLKYPLSNNWLEGTKIIQKYIYISINKFISRDKILVKSSYKLDTIESCYGILNWLSFYIYDSSEDDEILNEENIKVKEINYYEEDLYEVILEHELKEYYLDNEIYYLVLFIDINMENVEASTSNYCLNDNWFTRIYLQSNHFLQKNDQIIIYDMCGENIPIYGLSDNDKLTRQILNKDLETDEENLNKILKEPNENEIYKILDINDNYITIRGRYMGYNGSIRLVEKDKKTKIDLSVCNILANHIKKSLDNNLNIYQLYLDTDLLANNFLDSIKNKLTIDITPIDLNKNLDYDQNYIQNNFFYICSPELSNIFNIPKIDPSTQSLKGWSMPNNRLNKEKLLFKNQEMNKKNNLENIFNIINIDNYNKDLFIFNSFLDIPKFFYKEPINELYELEFIFLWKDGRLIDFNMLDHSFVLEICEEDGYLDKINPRTGNIYTKKMI